MTEEIINDTWRSISGYPTYQISNIGRVRNLDNNRISKGHDNGSGYLKTVLCQNGEQTSFYIHRLVAQEFLDNIDNKPKVDHVDGDRKNNSILNLRWVSDGENSRNRKRNKVKLSSRYKGVYWEKGSSKWRARINKDGIDYYCGLFLDETDAARAYNMKAIELYGDYALLNELQD